MTRMAVNHEEPGASKLAPEKYVGYGVLDPTGKKFGSIGRVFVNWSGEPEYIQVKMGLFGVKCVLLPVDSISVDDGKRFVTLE